MREVNDATWINAEHSKPVYVIMLLNLQISEGGNESSHYLDVPQS